MKSLNFDAEVAHSHTKEITLCELYKKKKTFGGEIKAPIRTRKTNKTTHCNLSPTNLCPLLLPSDSPWYP